MALQFRPPYQIDPNAESPELRGLNTLGAALQNVANTSGQWAQQERENKYKDLLMQLAKAKEAREAGQHAAEWGAPGTPSWMQSATPQVPISPTVEPYTPATPAVPNMTPDVSQPQPTGMVAKFRQWQEAQRNPQAQGFLGLSPDELRSFGLDKYSTYGTKQLEQIGKIAEEKRKLFAAPKAADTYNPDQVRALVPGDAGEKLIQAFPGGLVPKDAVHVAAAGGRFDMNLGERSDQFHIKQWNDLARRTNPAIAPKGSPLGLAGFNNQRADRAIALLTNPKASDQQLMAGTVDLAAIMHGGAPDEMEIAKQMYPTLRAKWNNLLTLVTSKPVAARQPEVQQKIREMIMDVKTVDNKTIEDNLNAAEEEYADTIARTPERWKRYRARIMGMTQFVPGTTTGAPDFGPGGGQTYQHTATNAQGQKVGWDGSQWVSIR